jgi:hypothetical protein
LICVDQLGIGELWGVQLAEVEQLVSLHFVEPILRRHLEYTHSCVQKENIGQNHAYF